MGNGDTPITQVYMPPRAAVLRLVEAGRRARPRRRPPRRAARRMLGRRRRADGGGRRARHPHLVLRDARQGRARRLSLARRSLLAWRPTTSSPSWPRMLHDDRPLFRQLSVEEKVSTARRFRETVQAHRARARRRRAARRSRRARSTTWSPASTRSCARAAGSGASSRSTPPTSWKMYVALELRSRASSPPRARCRSPDLESLARLSASAVDRRADLTRRLISHDAQTLPSDARVRRRSPSA